MRTKAQELRAKARKAHKKSVVAYAKYEKALWAGKNKQAQKYKDLSDKYFNQDSDYSIKAHILEQEAKQKRLRGY